MVSGEMGNFKSPHWRCKPCQDVFLRDQKKESERKENEDKVQQLRSVAAKYPVESKRVQELYTAIAGIYHEFQFPDGKTHIGCMSAEDHARVTKDTTRKLGCTYYLDAPKYDFFIVIFHEELETDASFLSVVIHEMAHRHYVIFIVPSGCHLRARASVVCLFHVLAFEFSWRLLNL